MEIPNNEHYGAEEIQVLEGLEAVRKRPGMYIGSTGPRGLHHLVYEIVDNAIDEALAGYCDEINVEILPDNIIKVTDNGRGIPTGIHAKEGISAATVVYTILHAGGKFGGGGYKMAGGLHGVGASVVNALSEFLELTIYDGENVHFQRFERGAYSERLKIIGKTDKKGTSVVFKADHEIFDDLNYDYEILLNRLREQAFLNAGIKIVIKDLRDADNLITEKLHYEGGIKSFVEHIHERKKLEVVHDEVIYISKSEKDSIVEIAMQYNDSYN
ncbi:MAG: ATP-binding protein, partial [Oscillospiraceae bacterium]